MPAGWDQWLVYLIVATAALYVFRGLFRRKRRNRAGCGCASTSETAPIVSELVQIEPARPRTQNGAGPRSAAS